MLGLTEEQLWDMSPRTFHNLLEGRVKRERQQMQMDSLRHSELIVAVLSPHMKKKDRDAAYREIAKEAQKISSETPKKGKKDPLKFWEEIDKRTRKAKEPPIPEG